MKALLEFPASTFCFLRLAIVVYWNQKYLELGRQVMMNLVLSGCKLFSSPSDLLCLVLPQDSKHCSRTT